jgi:hypothetical protein
VDRIKEVQWNPQTFHSVEIDLESKELIEALVRNKIDREEGIDFVQGKGTGLVVLLHGYVLDLANRMLLTDMQRTRNWQNVDCGRVRL